ncbi:DUF6477 family protein [Pseudotabrizicola sp. L79]|uniref:DUF6477 family protein n=1 Tax=Pseudotabrizicola sp. L79 TaxID=3118402 RepID=UPI002F91F79F
MTNHPSALAHLRRPRLLVRAARFGVADYRRDRDLRRLIGRSARPEDAVSLLLDAEGQMEENRKKGEATYSVAQHIEVLIALVAEARMIKPAVAE